MRLLNASLVRRILLTMTAALCGASAYADETNPSIVLSTRLTSDILGVVQSTKETRVRGLANLDVVADLDLENLVTWHGARIKLHGLSNHGGQPNNFAGTLQGVDNIEVTSNRTKLYQAWIEQDLFGGKVSLLTGLADLNADFYQNDSAGLLLAPAFGIGSELAATGPNGPSIFPSTALTARVRVALRSDVYVKAAVVNARSGVLGDPGGVDWGLREGGLLIGELGWTGRGKLAVGYWHYTKRQTDIRRAGIDGMPSSAIAQGAYLLVDQRLSARNTRGPAINVFARVGVSDGATTPFSGGGQLGVLITGLLTARPESQMSFGINRGILSTRYRANSGDVGVPLSQSETGLEMSFSDQLTSRLRVQPDLQYVIRPSGNRVLKDALIVGLRLIFTASTEID
jgi:porin